MTHIDRNKVLLGVCAVAAALAFAPASSAHGAGARGGAMTMAPPSAGPHPFDPSGHLGGPPVSSSQPHVPATPGLPRVDPPPPGAGSDTNTGMSGDVSARPHVRFDNPDAGGKFSGDVSGDVDTSASTPK
jgi:hypothetical protein